MSHIITSSIPRSVNRNHSTLESCNLNHFTTICVMGINYASFYNFSVRLRDFSDIVMFFGFSFYLTRVTRLMTLVELTFQGHMNESLLNCLNEFLLLSD